MPFAAQALLPFVALLVAAFIVRWRPRRRINGWIASGATGIAGVIALVELLRLAPGEHVDVPYLTTFPYADLAVRLDGLSLAFAAATLITAAALMVTRQLVRGDRRDPWFGWLLTSAAACAVILADNLLLLFIALQLLTLAWSGALDETARRRRGLRLTVQIADIGLLLAAASAIQSVGTSAFSGVPSDTFGLATFLLVLLPVAVRVGALTLVSSGPPAAVTFEPAVAWVAPAGYLLLRLLALMGGRLPDRPTAVALFGGGILVAIGFAVLALGRSAGVRLAAPLLAAQAALALSLSSGSEPLMTVASTWLWLLLIPLAGLVSVRVAGGSLAEALMLVNLAMVPGTVGFFALWLGGLALGPRGLLFGMIPVALAVILLAVSALGRAARVRSITVEPASIWGAVLLVIAAFPIIAINPMVLPAAATVRLVPRGTISATPLGIATSPGAWPALLVSLVTAVLLAIAGLQLRDRLPLRRGRGTVRWRIVRRLPLKLRPPAIPARTRYLLWGAFLLVVALAAVRP
jgi:hypothetical protein